MCCEARRRQSAKIREIADALVGAGIVSLDKQAAVLGLSRSTTWAILQADHKGSGLSASTINRMRATPALPAPVRIVLDEYVAAKSAGIYGHKETHRRKFAARLTDAAANGEHHNGVTHELHHRKAARHSR